MATRVGRRKCDWHHLPRKLPCRRKNVTDISHKPILSQISLPWQRGSVGGKCDWQHSMAHPENPSISAKISQKFFYASRVIANFVLNFVAIATGIDRGKMQLASFDGPSLKTPYGRKKSRKNFLRKRSYSPFCPKFRCHGNGGRSVKNAIGSILWPISDNPPIGGKISQKSHTQAKL